MKETILNLLKSVPTADEIAYHELSSQEIIGVIIILAVVIILMPVFIFWVIGEKMGA